MKHHIQYEHIDWHCTLQWWIHVRSFIMHQKLEQYQLVKSIVAFIISWWFWMVSCINTKVRKSQDLSHGRYNISTLVPCLHSRESKLQWLIMFHLITIKTRYVCLDYKKNLNQNGHYFEHILYVCAHVKLSNLTNVTNAIESIIYKYGWLWL